MLVISYDVDDDEVQEYFTYAGYRARDMRDPFRRTLSLIHSIASANFFTEGGLVGGWEPLTPRYAKWKARTHGSRPMLVLSPGAPLRRAATSQGTVNKTGLRYRPTARNQDGFDYAEPIYLGRVDGGGPHDSEMAARPWFDPEDQEFLDNVEAIFYEWLDDVRSRNRRRTGEAVRPAAPSPTYVI